MGALRTQASISPAKCPAFKAFFERITAGKPERKKIAIVATSHRLIRVMGAMMRTGTAYDANYRS